MEHMKQRLSDVTNLQQTIKFPSPQYVEVITHRRFFESYSLYLLALASINARMWEIGKPEWQRNIPSHFVYGG
jgi:hypothetical protein